MYAYAAVVGQLYELDQKYYQGLRQASHISKVFKYGRFILCVESCNCDRDAWRSIPHKRFLTLMGVVCMSRIVMTETTFP